MVLIGFFVLPDKEAFLLIKDIKSIKLPDIDLLSEVAESVVNQLQLPLLMELRARALNRKRQNNTKNRNIFATGRHFFFSSSFLNALS